MMSNGWINIGFRVNLSIGMRIFLASFFAGMLILSPIASAQYTPFRLPEHVTVQVHGDRYEAFDLGGFQELLRMDEDLRQCTDQTPALEAQVTELRGAVGDLQAVVDLRDSSITLLTSERDRLQQQYLEENRLRLEAENRPDIGSWVAWSLAGLGGVVIVVLSVIIAVSGGM